jgi:hypothetical protein
MEVAVVSIEGKETGRKAKLDKAVFGIEPNEHAIYLDVKSHLANKRQGTHQSKERGEIVGSTRKIKNKKEQVLPVREVSRILCSVEEVVYSVHHHVTIHRKSTKK